MKNVDEFDCRAAREALSARLDGELADERALLGHLLVCAECRALESELSALALELRELRAAQPPADLWTRIEARALPRATPRARVVARLAAGLIGFLGLGGAAFLVERQRQAPPPTTRPNTRPSTHLFERLRPAAAPDEQVSLFASLPEYQLLRRFPHDPENSR